MSHPLRSPIKHCRNCGNAVVYRVPDDGDTHERAVCAACDTIHYENPLNVVGTVPYWGEQVLLCKRNIEPRVGQVHLFYRARLLSDHFEPGHETLEARLFSEAEIPWDEIAFKTVRE